MMATSTIYSQLTSKIKMFAFFTIGLGVLFLALVSAGDDDIKRVMVVKPGEEIHTHVEEMDGMTCSFTYSAQGGTQEEWNMIFVRGTDGASWGCMVQRKSSYLYFKSFTLQAEGMNVNEYYAMAGTSELASSEVVFDKEASTVKEGAKFRNQLAMVGMFETPERSEL